jgi:hypothetical protein
VPTPTRHGTLLLFLSIPTKCTTKIAYGSKIGLDTPPRGRKPRVKKRDPCNNNGAPHAALRIQRVTKKLRVRHLIAELTGIFTCCLLKPTFMFNPFYPQSPLFCLLSFNQKNILDTPYYSLPSFPFTTHLRLIKFTKSYTFLSYFYANFPFSNNITPFNNFLSFYSILPNLLPTFFFPVRLRNAL